MPAALIVGFVLACPSAFAAAQGCEATAARPQDSIRAEELANWEPIDERALLIWTSHDSRAHLVELDRPLPGLLDAPTVFLVTPGHDRTVSACGDDEVLVPGGAVARIISIRYLSEKRTAELDPESGDTARTTGTFT